MKFTLKTRFYWTALAIWIFISPVSSLADETGTNMSLKRCLEIGLEKNQNIVNAKLEVKKVHYQKQEAASMFFPQVEGYSTYENYLDKPAGLTSQYNMAVGFKATQLIYNKTAFTALDLSKKVEETSAVNFEKVASDLIYELSAHYFEIQAIDKRRMIVRENIAQLNRLLRIIEAQHKAGIVRNIEVQRVKVDRENLVTKLGTIETQHIKQIELLKYMAGIDSQSIFKLSDPIENPLLSGDLHSRAFNGNRPELQLLKKQTEMASINQQLASSEHYPTLSFYAQYFYQAQSDSPDFSESGEDLWEDVGIIGLTFSIPIFDGFGTRSKVNQATINHIQASINYEYNQRYFGLEYENAIKQYQNSKDSEVRQRDNTRLAQTIYEQMLAQYQQGIASLSDLLKTENSLSESHLGLFDTMLQLRLSELEILRASGDLRSILN